MTTFSNTRTTRLGMLALVAAFGISAMSPAFARGGDNGGGGANPMQINNMQNIQNIQLPPQPKKMAKPRSIKACGGESFQTAGGECKVSTSSL